MYKKPVQLFFKVKNRYSREPRFLLSTIYNLFYEENLFNVGTAILPNGSSRNQTF